MNRLPAHMAYARASAAVVLRYRAALFTSMALLLVQVFVLTRIWHALYGTHTQEAGLSVHSTIVYLTVTNLQTLVMSSSVALFVADRVRQGSIAADLARPVGFVSQMLWWHGGEAVVLVAVDLLLVPVAMLVGGFGAPGTAGTAALYVAALALGWAVNAVIVTLIGLSSFWLVNVWSVSAVTRIGGQLLGGVAVPLVFFPSLLQKVAEALPFQFTGYVPAAVYVGALRGGGLGRDFAVGLGWVVVLGVSVRLVEQRARRKLTVAGG